MCNDICMTKKRVQIILHDILKEREEKANVK